MRKFHQEVKLKAFVGGVCVRSKKFFLAGAVFSNKLFRLKKTL